MKITIKATIDVDVDTWMLCYGVERNQVRNDVKTYFEHQIREQLQHIGCDKVENDAKWAEEQASYAYNTD